MHAFVRADEMALQKLSGIIADLLVDFTNVGGTAPGGGGADDSLFSLVRTLADTKTLACGKNYRSFHAENPYKRKNYPVEKRAALVPKQYLSKDRSLDHQLHGTARGTVGPIEAELLEYGALTDLTHTPSWVLSSARSASSRPAAAVFARPLRGWRRPGS
jgi:hypothetical protein